MNAGDIHLNLVHGSGMGKGFNNRFIRIIQFHIFTNQCNLDLLFRTLQFIYKLFPFLQIG